MEVNHHCRRKKFLKSFWTDQQWLRGIMWVSWNHIYYQIYFSTAANVWIYLYLYRQSYRSGGFFIFNLEVGHSFDDGHDGLDCVAVDHGSVLLTLIFWVSILMNNPGEKKHRVEEKVLKSPPLHTSEGDNNFHKKILE